MISSQIHRFLFLIDIHLTLYNDGFCDCSGAFFPSQVLHDDGGRVIISLYKRNYREGVRHYITAGNGQNANRGNGQGE